jgi:hypothetical protein
MGEILGGAMALILRKKGFTTDGIGLGACSKRKRRAKSNYMSEPTISRLVNSPFASDLLQKQFFLGHPSAAMHWMGPADHCERRFLK